MADKLMYIPNDDTQNDPFFRLQFVIKTLNTQLNELTNQHSPKVPKVFNRMIVRIVFLQEVMLNIKKRANFSLFSL